MTHQEQQEHLMEEAQMRVELKRDNEAHEYQLKEKERTR